MFEKLNIHCSRLLRGNINSSVEWYCVDTVTVTVDEVDKHTPLWLAVNHTLIQL